MPTYHAAQLVNRHWVQPGAGRHTVYLASCSLKIKGNYPQVTAYALRRPDGKLSVLLLNKDPRKAVTVRVARKTQGTQRPVTGDLDLFQYSPLQWNWVADPQGRSYPDLDLPPFHTTMDDGRAVVLPPYSVTVVRTAKAL
jgi:hypothetical protein